MFETVSEIVKWNFFKSIQDPYFAKDQLKNVNNGWFSNASFNINDKIIKLIDCVKNVLLVFQWSFANTKNTYILHGGKIELVKIWTMNIKVIIENYKE